MFYVYIVLQIALVFIVANMFAVSLFHAVKSILEDSE